MTRVRTGMKATAAHIWALATAAVVLVPALATNVRAQDWRTLESSRPLAGNAPIDVRVAYGAGTVEIAPGTGAALYRMTLRYDADLTTPMATFDTATRVLQLGTKSTGVRASWHGREQGGRLRAELTDRTPLRLTLELGAAQADLELGGLRLRTLDVRTGAAKVRMRVSTPNVDSLAEAAFDVGAADVVMQRGGNLRTPRVSLNVGVGAMDYDFSGSWSGDIDADVSVAMGSMTLRIPVDIGVRVMAQTFLVDFSPAGLIRRGDVWESPGYDQASRHIRVRAHGAFASLTIVRP